MISLVTRVFMCPSYEPGVIVYMRKDILGLVARPPAPTHISEEKWLKHKLRSGLWMRLGPTQVSSLAVCTASNNSWAGAREGHYLLFHYHDSSTLCDLCMTFCPVGHLRLWVTGQVSWLSTTEAKLCTVHWDSLVHLSCIYLSLFIHISCNQLSKIKTRVTSREGLGINVEDINCSSTFITKCMTG